METVGKSYKRNVYIELKHRNKYIIFGHCVKCFCTVEKMSQRTNVFADKKLAKKSRQMIFT